MLRFTQVELKNWRNFKHVNVALQGRAFLVGPNASGKSNFLDVFRFLHDLVAVGGGFQQAVQKRGGVSKLRCMSARESSDITLHVQMIDNDTQEVWDYQLTFNQDRQRRPQISAELVKHNDRIVLNRPDENDKNDPERLTQTYVEQVNANRSFRDVFTFFQAVRYLHIVPQLVREPERSVNRSDDPFGGDFLEQMATAKIPTQQARLRKIKDALKIAIPQLIDLRLEKDERGIPHLQAKYQHWRPQGIWLNEDQFSDGTLRLMGLLWSILDGTGPLLLEEPELSLHPSIIRRLPQIFASTYNKFQRQILMSSHSNDLLRDEGIGFDEVLVFRPTQEGTEVKLALDIPEITRLVGGDLSLADAVLPLTEPKNVFQLALFAEKQ
ncbi:MAG: AAA family ATPase [Anaerolineae bacterium]|nr:AAA family ATPase [Anaerolineae bacterium]